MLPHVGGRKLTEGDNASIGNNVEEPERVEARTRPIVTFGARLEFRSLNLFRHWAPVREEVFQDSMVLLALYLLTFRTLVGSPVTLSTTFGRNSISGISLRAPLLSSSLIRLIMLQMNDSVLPSPRYVIIQERTPFTKFDSG